MQSCADAGKQDLCGHPQIGALAKELCPLTCGQCTPGVAPVNQPPRPTKPDTIYTWRGLPERCLCTTKQLVDCFFTLPSLLLFCLWKALCAGGTQHVTRMEIFYQCCFRRVSAMLNPQSPCSDILHVPGTMTEARRLGEWINHFKKTVFFEIGSGLVLPYSDNSVFPDGFGSFPYQD